ncbi:MAG: adenylyltransferase/cytidyltransferase family protein [Thermodesulfobacteriota bacterium]
MNLAHPKVLDRAALPARLAELRRGRRLVFTNGCFDLLHPGHCDLLARCRALGDLLLVAVNSDESVGRLKGPSRPVTPLAERMFVLAHLDCVDLVTSFHEDTPYEILGEVLPDVLAKGGDWPVEKIVGRDLVESRGGRVASLPLLPGFSTTEAIRRIVGKSGRTA